MSAERVSMTSVQALQGRVRELSARARKAESLLRDIRAWTMRTEGLPEEQLQWRLKCIRTCMDDPDRPVRNDD